MHKHILALALTLSVRLSGDSSGENWPQFRGPTGQGHAVSNHLPTEWSETKNVVWKQTIPGQGWSSPVLFEGRIYLTSALTVENAPSPSLRALCLDAQSGAALWNTEVFTPGSTPSARIHNKNSHASATPVVEAGRLYVHFGYQGTASLDLEGKVLWRNDRLHYSPVHGNGGSPALVDDALVFSCDGAGDPFVVALNKTTGELLWRMARESDAKSKFSFSTPLVITVNGQRQIISSGSNVVNAYDPKTGREIWRVRYDGYSVVPRPVYAHGLLFIATGFDRPAVMAIRPDGQGDVTATHVAWTVTRGAPNTPSLLVVGDELYMCSDAGVASCLDAKTGQVHWQERIGGNCSASPVHAGGRIYFQNEAGLGVVIQAGTEFKKIAENALNERTLASYAADENAFFIRGEKHLFRIQAH